jgi:hypothetical protein
VTADALPFVQALAWPVTVLILLFVIWRWSR